MTRKERQHKRAVANGEVYRPSRKPAMPSPKIIQLKNGYHRERFDTRDDWER